MNKHKVMAFAVLIVALEVLLPIPGPLTLISVYILLARPPWFRKAIDLLYSS